MRKAKPLTLPSEEVLTIFRLPRIASLMKPTPASVSYTHLDVYKRQVKSSPDDLCIISRGFKEITHLIQQEATRIVCFGFKIRLIELRQSKMCIRDRNSPAPFGVERSQKRSCVSFLSLFSSHIRNISFTLRCQSLPDLHGQGCRLRPVSGTACRDYGW